ncbi:MAG: hypothetical protein K0A93_12310 [Desulfuromonadaceae bacterium]|nr:hypothetical protein [Desulfuromonadaceae bacterium]
MGFIKKLFEKKERAIVEVPSKMRTAGFVAALIDHVIENNGIFSLVDGSLVLTKSFNVRFAHSTDICVDEYAAVVKIKELENAALFVGFRDKGKPEADSHDKDLFSFVIDQCAMEVMCSE